MLDDSPRGRILRAAARLFLTKGYAQTTVRDLAQDVGILSGSLFHHFESKQAILEAVMTEASLRSIEQLQQASQACTDPVQRVRSLLRCELETIHGEGGEAMVLLAVEWRSLDPEAQDRVLVLRKRYEHLWLEALGAAHEALQPIEPLIMRRLLLGMTSGSATWYRPRGRLSLDGLTDHILSLMLARPAQATQEPVRRDTRAARRKN